VKYLLAIYDDEARWPSLDEETQQAEIDAYWRLDHEAEATGELIISQALAPSTWASSVRVRGGEVLVTDGPFAETKEQLGGFYLLDCDDLARAIEWASKVPAARNGRVEVRAVAEFERDDRPLAAESA
jgi:hypothetical protein